MWTTGKQAYLFRYQRQTKRLVFLLYYFFSDWFSVPPQEPRTPEALAGRDRCGSRQQRHLLVLMGKHCLRVRSSCRWRRPGLDIETSSTRAFGRADSIYWAGRHRVSPQLHYHRWYNRAQYCPRYPRTGSFDQLGLTALVFVAVSPSPPR